MTDSLEAARQMVETLIARANRVHRGATWSYELTSEVDNIEVAIAVRGCPGPADPPLLAPLRRGPG